MKLSSVLWNYCIMNASVCLESSICSQVCQQEHVTQMQLTPINIIMEGHEDIRIPIQIRMIPWWKTLKSQSIPIYFSKHSALQSGTDSHVKKKTDDSLSPKSQRRKRQLQKKTQTKLAGGLSWRKDPAFAVWCLLFSWALSCWGGRVWAME